jgi:hypothetical protein
MRAHESKTSVRVSDYADVRGPALRAMHARPPHYLQDSGIHSRQPFTAEPSPQLPFLRLAA